MDEVIRLTPDEEAMLRAALAGPLRPSTALERHRAINLAGRCFLSRAGSRRPWLAAGPRGPSFVLSQAGWAYLSRIRMCSGHGGVGSIG